MQSLTTVLCVCVCVCVCVCCVLCVCVRVCLQERVEEGDEVVVEDEVGGDTEEAKEGKDEGMDTNAGSLCSHSFRTPRVGSN